MDPTNLANQKIEEGANLLRSLDKENYTVSSAFWYYYPEEKKWKFFIASPNYDTDGPESVNQKLQNYVFTVNENGLAFPDITTIGPNNILIRLLRVAIQTPPNVISGIWLRDTTIKNTHIDAVYVYRLM